MRSALICVFLTLIVRSQEVSQSSAINEFRPTPIPLTEWHQEQRAGRTKTVLELASTTATSSQGHYWEDALKHSVYLTLVRDKIDKLIAQGDVISPEKKPEPYIPKDIDDHDLWEKIKSASFDRIKEDEPDTYGDVTILAKGRLLEENGRYRFAEDDRNQQKCYNDTCMNGVKAIWSVKRVRQRDSESLVGSHHNELTFSVISQPAKKQKKPYENPIRTFTVREKQEEQNHHYLERSKSKPARMVWFHKNIVPTPKYHRQSLDRIFSSLFFDDDEELPQRHLVRPPPYGSVYNPYSKVAYPGSPSDQLQQKKPLQPPYKIRTKIVKTHLGGPMHPTIYTPDSSPSSPYPSQSADHRYVLPIQPVSTTKSNNLSSTPSPLPVPPNSVENGTVQENLLNTTEYTSKTAEIITVPPRYPNYGRPKNPTMKVKYYPEHIRPPVYNAPPGVFVTMDKKPFKPMPPLKLLHGKPMKSLRPSDFRPSPQILDIQFSEPDPFSDTAFRPITVNYDNNVTTEKIKTYEPSKHEDRRPSFTNRNPPKKHENIKAEKITTSAPEIITAHNEVQEIESPSWNILGALSKTTPMAVAITEQTETKEEEEYLTTTTTTTTTTTPPPTTTTAKKRTTTTTEPPETTTTPKANKRTRPPPDFKKTERKYKKNKRRTTTSTKRPDTLALKAEHDLTPQASSSATSSSKLQKDSSKKPISSTTSSPTTKNSATFNSTANINETTLSSSNTWTKNYTTTMASTKKNSATTLPSIKMTTPIHKTSTISTVNTTSINTPATNVSTTNPATTSSVISTAAKPSAAKATIKATKLFISKPTHKTTTTKTTTSTEPPTKITIVTEPTNLASTTQPKNKNRFRQSTLMQKGTSVNHDKWSVIPTSIEKSKSILPVSGAFSPRRKGSNFQGYITSTPKNTELDEADYHISSPYISKSSTIEKPVTDKVMPQGQTIKHDELDNESSASTMYDQIQYPDNDVEDIDAIESLDSFDEPGDGGGNDFIYDVLPLQTTQKQEFEHITYDELVTSFPPKNKTKCKKKKSQNLTTTTEQETEEVITTTATTTTITSTTPNTTPTTTSTSTSTKSQALSTPVNGDSNHFTKPKEKARDPDIFETLFGFNLNDDFNLNETEYLDIQEQQSEHKLKYLESEDNENEFEGTFDSFDEKPRRQAAESEYDVDDYDDEKKTILDGHQDDSPFDSEELKNLAESQDQDDYPTIEEEDHMSLLELMGM